MKKSIIISLCCFLISCGNHEVKSDSLIYYSTNYVGENVILEKLQKDLLENCMERGEKLIQLHFNTAEMELKVDKSSSYWNEKAELKNPLDHNIKKVYLNYYLKDESHSFKTPIKIKFDSNLKANLYILSQNSIEEISVNNQIFDLKVNSLFAKEKMSQLLKDDNRKIEQELLTFEFSEEDLSFYWTYDTLFQEKKETTITSGGIVNNYGFQMLVNSETGNIYSRKTHQIDLHCL